MSRAGETGSWRFDPDRWQPLRSPRRYALLDPVAFLQRIGFAQGSTVADLGADPGFFTLPVEDPTGFRRVGFG
jgi:hypothetical protein